MRGIEGVSGFVSDTKQAIWILTTACFEPEGREFESLRARHSNPRSIRALARNCNFDFLPISTDLTDDWLWYKRRNVESEPDLSRLRLPPFIHLEHLLCILSGDVVVLVTHPKLLQVLGHELHPKHRGTKTSERVCSFAGFLANPVFFIACSIIQSCFVCQLGKAALYIKCKSHYPMESDISAFDGYCNSRVSASELAKLSEIS